MADLPVTPLADYGQLLSSLPLADSTIATQSAQQGVARANIGNIQANTALTGVQTQGANIANQRAGLQLQYAQQLQSYLAGNGSQPNQTPPSSAPTKTGDPGSLEAAGIAQDQIQAGIDKRFYVNPAWNPQEMRGLALASGSGQPGAVEAVTAQHDKRVQAQQAVSTQQASSMYDTMHGVATIPDNAPAGTALKMLERSLDPEVRDSAKHIQAIADQNGLSAKETDKLAKTLAAESGGATFVYSKYAADAKRDTDGVLKDVRGRQVLESTQSGLSAPQQAERQIKLAEPVVYGNQLPQPIGTASGISGPQTPSAPVQPPAPRQPQASVASNDPVLDKALADSSYRFQQPFPKPTTQEQQAANVDAQKANIAASQTLKSQSDQATAGAAAAQTYLQAAKKIIDTKGAAVGAYGGLIAKASSFVGDYKGDASNYQELSKYLNNAAIAAAKGNYGSGLTEKELELQLTGASPSVDKTPGALKALVEANLRNTKYTLDTASRVVPYLNKGNDPTNFNKWNQGTWNQSAAVNAPKSTSTTMPSGDKLSAYAAAHFGGDTSKAQAYLQSQGFK